MRELMLELLTWEPYGKLLPEEEKYIREILSGNYYQPKSMLNDLFVGFFHYVQRGNYKDIDWLRHWKETYHQNQNYTYSTKSERAYYPLLLKKICLYIIVRGEFNDKEFMGGIGLPVNLIRKWHVSPKFRKYSEADSYSIIRSFRSGVKKEYVVSLVKRLYHEAGRQTSQSMLLKNLPPLIDVFSGTGSVAASVVSDGCSPQIVNDYDPTMVCFIWAFTYHQKELRSRIAKRHNKLMKQDFDSTDWSYEDGTYDKHYRKLKYPKSTIAKGKKAQRYKRFIIRVRSNYLEAKAKLDSCDRESLRNIDFNALPKHTIDQQVDEILDYAVSVFFYYAFKPMGKNGNAFHVTCVDERSYFAYLNRLNADLKAARRKEQTAKAWSLTKLRLYPASLTLQSTGNFSRHLQGAKFYSQDFRNILQNGPSKGIYYLDSEYFLTSSYDIPFSDDDHKELLDTLRNAEFSWIFSLQYNPSARSTCTRDSDEKKRRSQPHIIRDYGVYYRGFYSPLQLDTDQRVYIPADASKQAPSNLFAILFDFDAVRKRWPQMSRPTSEMIAVNFNCLPAIPLHDVAVVLPFDLFLQCADDGMAYQEIVQRAIAWRKSNIESNYTGKGAV